MLAAVGITVGGLVLKVMRCPSDQNQLLNWPCPLDNSECNRKTIRKENLRNMRSWLDFQDTNIGKANQKINKWKKNFIRRVFVCENHRIGASA